jgi:hypothetical protein
MDEEERKMTRTALQSLCIGVLGLAFATQASAIPIFSGDSGGRLYSIESTTGTSTLIGAMGTTMTDLALSTSGQLYGITFSNLYSINSSTGASTLIGAHGVGGGNALAFNSSDVLYVSGGSTLATLNLGTGASTFIGSTGQTSSGDLAFDLGGTLYATVVGADGDDLVTLNTGTAASTTVGSTGFVSVFGLAFDANSLIGLTASGRTLSISTTTGAGTVLNANGVATFGAAAGPPIPEPTAFIVFGIGAMVAGGAAVARRRAA